MCCLARNHLGVYLVLREMMGMNHSSM